MLKGGARREGGKKGIEKEREGRKEEGIKKEQRQDKKEFQQKLKQKNK